MKKKELMTIAPLKLTSYLMKVAKKDEPVKQQHWKTDKNYKYGRYLRVKEEKGYLVISVFLTQFVRAGARHPFYVVYIDKSANDFITFETDTGKWRKSMLYNLDWPRYMYGSGTYISRRDKKLVCRYLGTETGEYEELEHYQARVREQQLIVRHRKKTDAWDEVMKQVPGIPKDWERWLLRNVVSEHYIFYKYKRGGATEGYCTHCGKMVPIKAPKYNESGICSRCGQEIHFKSVDKSKSIWTETKAAYLIQRCKKGIILRLFEVAMVLGKGDFHNPEIWYSEIKRIFYDDQFREEPYYYGDFKNRGTRWIAGESDSRRVGFYYYYSYSPIYGKVYPRTLPDLEKKELKRTGLRQWIQGNMILNPRKYLGAWRKIPVLEQIVKAGLTRLAGELVENPEKLVWKDSTGELAKRLWIDKAELKRLRKMDGGFHVLCWLKQEKKEDICLPDELIGWFIEKGILPKDLAFIHDRMSYVQIKNYLVRQKGKREDSIRQVLITWEDYLSMAKRVKMNVYDAIVYRANKLYQRHGELVEYIQKNQLSVTAGELEEEYPYINGILPRLQEKYEYSNKTYTILAPRTVKDILEEGQALHHCIDKKKEYFERINNQESFILFLRKTKQPDQPYYTLEVEPGGVIRQKRTEYDRQKKDIDKASAFLRKWQKVVQKRLTGDDFALAEKSREIRIESYAEMRKKRVKINGGLFAGQYLADVLEADLMELPDAEKEAA
ncbi:MAG: hypothetical protein HFG77_07600 [Hungatella sp.]|nr:hypothetical protein C818_00266 [Lachnospiraceae bacterium MD308]MCI9636246.1 hypothetical protein [Hungatella sp.]